MTKGGKGFTLIELLVVIAIIALLASIVLVSLNSARMKARDARRQSDLRSVQTANELYYDAQAPSVTYADSVAALVTAAYLGSEPLDPKTGAVYTYTLTDTDHYKVQATLEKPPATKAGFECTQAGCNYY